MAAFDKEMATTRASRAFHLGLYFFAAYTVTSDVADFWSSFPYPERWQPYVMALAIFVMTMAFGGPRSKAGD